MSFEGTPSESAPEILEQVTLGFCDDDPAQVASRLAPLLERRWSDESVVPHFAAPFFAVVSHAWDRHLP